MFVCTCGCDVPCLEEWVSVELARLAGNMQAVACGPLLDCVVESEGLDVYGLVAGPHVMLTGARKT